MKKIGLKILGIVIILIVLLQNTMVFAAADTSALENEQNKNKEQINDLNDQKDQVQEEKSNTQEEVNDLSAQISDYQAQINDLNSKINDLNNQIEESQKKLDEAQAKYNENKKLAEERLVVMQESGDTTYLDLILSSDSITDLISGYYLASELAEADTELLSNLESERQEVEKAKQDLESKKKELDTSKASKQSITTQLQTAKNEKTQKVADLSEDEKELQARIDELQEENDRIAGEIQEAQRKYAAQIAALNNKKNNSSSSSNSSGSNSSGGSSGGSYNSGSTGRLQRPVSSGRVTAGMTYPSGGYHGGIDFGVSSGTPVYAADDGVVIKTANLTTSYGTYVVIQHAGGLQTWYAHGTRGSILVSPGQTVSRGQQIMLSGNTGNSTGPHLHFEVRVAPYTYRTCNVNPTNYF